MNSTVSISGLRPRVGLLATQGDYAMHRKMVESLGYDCTEVRTVEHLSNVDCLIMPGGESTTMRKILKIDGLWSAIRNFGAAHAIMGTCAGLILLSKRIVNGRSDEDTLGLIDIDADRNAYGSQFHSCRATGQVTIGNVARSIEMVLIRAPQITRIGESVEVLARVGERPMMVRQGNILALTFHPEMGDDPSIHTFFVESIAGPLLKSAKSKAA